MPRSLSYVLPIRAEGTGGLDELTRYLVGLAHHIEVIVVNGSPAAVYAAHADRWGTSVRHLRPHDDLRFLSGKVNGVTTGVREASHDRVVIADDDVRYDWTTLDRMARELTRADVVRPQNYFDPLPWHARWDGARSLINRGVTGADHPGTLGIRRGRFLAAGGYDGDVLFENLELVRTIRASGGVVVTPRDMFVRRLPPTTDHFLSQRVRQAYDDFGQPSRLVTALSLLPALALAGRRRARLALGVAIGAIAVAERGRRRGGACAVFPPGVSLMAPLWVMERAACSWLAVASRVRFGGVPYGGVVMRTAANRPAVIRRRLAEERAAPPPPRAP